MSDPACNFAAMRYFIRLRYKGTDYHGWQVQNNATSVQQAVNRALSLVLRQEIETLGCGRTDTGVHAEDFYAHFDVDQPIENATVLLNKLTSMKIPGIQFRSLHAVADTAHARFDAVYRQYEYRITTERNPFHDHLAHYLFGTLDVEAMNLAARQLLGKQDFGAFSKVHTQVFTNICTVTQAVWEEKNGMLVFTIRADRFLRNMVRAVVGTLLEMGQGKRSVEEMTQIIASQNRSQAGMSVPACGLFLTEVGYPENILSLVGNDSASAGNSSIFAHP